jgi:alpha-tubulin suppressor-like RCC1 family protein
VATAIATGSDHACARTTNGKIACWGDNTVGQAGDPVYAIRSLPIEVSGLSGAKDVGAGDAHTCAILDGATVACWGDGRRGQLGDGVVAARKPSAVRLPCH